MQDFEELIEQLQDKATPDDAITVEDAVATDDHETLGRAIMEILARPDAGDD